MKTILTLAILSFTAPAFAGGYDDPIVVPAVISDAATQSSSSGGVVMTLVSLAVILAVITD